MSLRLSGVVLLLLALREGEIAFVLFVPVVFETA